MFKKRIFKVELSLSKTGQMRIRITKKGIFYYYLLIGEGISLNAFDKKKLTT